MLCGSPVARIRTHSRVHVYSFTFEIAPPDMTRQHFILPLSSVHRSVKATQFVKPHVRGHKGFFRVEALEGVGEAEPFEADELNCGLLVTPPPVAVASVRVAGELVLALRFSSASLCAHFVLPRLGRLFASRERNDGRAL